MTLELEWTRASAGLYFSGPYKITKTSKGWVTQFNNLDVSHLSTLNSQASQIFRLSGC